MDAVTVLQNLVLLETHLAPVEGRQQFFPVLFDPLGALVTADELLPVGGQQFFQLIAVHQRVHCIHAVHAAFTVKYVGQDLFGPVLAVHRDIPGMTVVDRRAADQYRNIIILFLQHAGDGDHVVRGLYQQGAQTDGIGVFRPRGFDEFLQRHLHTEINRAVPVVVQKGLRQVLADAVYVLVHGADDHHAFVIDGGSRLVAAGVTHPRLEKSHDVAHHVGAFEQMRQAHLAAPEAVAQLPHGLHQVIADEIQGLMPVQDLGGL